ncbi:hypothetical protein J1TS5_03970 [Paenibacillus macerans]|uniref:hypothetical protein n=1 Tax=Paenibacillus macerans TaxID=44252 RepID=UPI001B29AB98|nr:hypothetical protein [Paenibacillus macerans]GIP08227.1 hypothetical protein J1TS5_03970 [Paenibacillus macerans]
MALINVLPNHSNSSIGYYSYSIFFVNIEKLERKLKEPFRQSIDPSAPSYLDKTKRMYTAYKQMPAESLTLIKLKLKTYDFSNNLVIQLVELLHKLVTTAAATILGIVVTVSISMATFLQNNTELKKDYSSWVSSINEIFKLVSILINKYTDFLFILLLIFISVTSYSIFMQKKKATVDEHLLILDQIEKERS